MLLRPLKSIPLTRPVHGREYNELIRRVNLLSTLDARGGLVMQRTPAGMSVSAGGTLSSILDSTFLGTYLRAFMVLTAATGDGNYNALQMTLDEDEWTSTDGGSKWVRADTIKAWASGNNYTADDVRSYSGTYYVCNTTHTATAADIPSTSSYWDKIYQWAKATVAWDSGHGVYNVGDLVTYSGKHYRCILQHTAAVGKEPTNTTYWLEIYQTDNHQCWTYQTIAGEIDIYECTSTHVPADSKQPPNSTYWDSKFQRVVHNVNESYPETSYTPALAIYDIIVAWQIKDDEGNARWIGLPAESSVRRVRSSEAAPAATNITCNVMLRNGSEASAANSELGSAIEVYADICGGGNLNAAVPRIADDDELFAVNIQGKWWFTTVFNASQDCS